MSKKGTSAKGATGEFPRFKSTATSTHVDKFLHYVEIPSDPDACWKWHGGNYSDKGLPRIKVGKQSKYSYRVSWEIHTGKALTKDVFITIKCKNLSCSNPRHLAETTHDETMFRTATEGLHKKKKLTIEQKVEAMRRVIIDGEAKKSVARSLGVKHTSIRCQVSSRHALQLFGDHMTEHERNKIEAKYGIRKGIQL